MILENFATKYFTETITLQGFGEGGIGVGLIKAAFFELSSREMVTFTEGGRHQTTLEIVCSLINTPRRFHRFKNALSRRVPGLLDEVDDYDLLLIAALEACDAAILRLMIEHGNEIFYRNNISDEVRKTVEGVQDSIQKEAFTLLINRDNDDAIDRYLRAAAKEHWRASFFGVGPFISIMKWVKLLSDDDEDRVLSNLKDLLAEVAGQRYQNYEIVTDTLKELFEKKYDVREDSAMVSKIIQEVWHAKLGRLVTPPLARIVQKKLAQQPAEARYNLLKIYLSLGDVDSSFSGRLFFYLVENPNRGRVGSDMTNEQVSELSSILVSRFRHNKENLDLSESCLSYIARVKWAAKTIGVDDPTIEVVISKMKDPRMMETFVNSLLSMRHPWQPKFSDNHVELIQRLIGIDNFMRTIASSDYPKVNQLTANTLDDFKVKYTEVDGDVASLIRLFD